VPEDCASVRKKSADVDGITGTTGPKVVKKSADEDGITGTTGPKVVVNSVLENGTVNSVSGDTVFGEPEKVAMNGVVNDSDTLETSSTQASKSPSETPQPLPELANEIIENGKSEETDSGFSDNVTKNGESSSIERKDGAHVIKRLLPVYCDRSYESSNDCSNERKYLESLLTKNVQYSHGHIVENEEDANDESVKSQKTVQKAKKSAGPSKLVPRGLVKKFSGSDIMTINLAPIANVKLKLPNVDEAGNVKRTRVIDNFINNEPETNHILPRTIDDTSVPAAKMAVASVRSTSVPKSGASLYTVTGKRRKVSAMKRKRRRKTGTYKLPQIHRKAEYIKKKLAIYKGLGKETNNNTEVNRDSADMKNVTESDANIADGMGDESVKDKAEVGHQVSSTTGTILTRFLKERNLFIRLPMAGGCVDIFSF
jgi:hypothetical protein